MRPLSSWFLPEQHDVLDLLRRQAGAVDAAVRTVCDWSVGALPQEQAVQRLRELRDAENAQRRALHVAVRESFSTPLEPEDVFELAERLVEVLEESYALVREAQLTDVEPDEALREISGALARCSTILLDAVGLLPSARAAEVSDAAVVELQAVEHGYRQAMAGLAGADVHRKVMRSEVYRRAEHLGLALRRVARRVWYAVAKLD